MVILLRLSSHNACYISIKIAKVNTFYISIKKILTDFDFFFLFKYIYIFSYFAFKDNRILPAFLCINNQ